MIDKSETVEECAVAVRKSKVAGLEVAGTFILGWPTETDEDRRAGFDLAIELDTDVVRFNIATPCPGTTLYNRVNDDPGFNRGVRWANMNSGAYWLITSKNQSP